MKQLILKLAAVAFGALAMTTSASATTYYFLNSAADHDFGNVANWNTNAAGTGSVMSAFAASDDLDIEKSGANYYAEMSASYTADLDELRIGVSAGNTGELRITGGTHNILNTFRASRQGGSAIIVISGGTINVPNSYTTIGDSTTTATYADVTMTGGEWNSDRQTWGQRAVDVVDFNMSGGTINCNYSDTTPASSSGGFRMGAGTTNIYLSGTAVINTRKLYIWEGGVLHFNGGTMNVTGSDPADINVGPDTILGTADDYQNPTFDFSETSIITGLDDNYYHPLNGAIDYNSGNLNITGDYESLFDTAIQYGKVYTSTFGYKVDAVYNGGSDLTTLALIALQPGDANDDGMVNLADLQILGDNWQSTTATWSTADFTGDGEVNLADLQILGDNWGFGVGADLSFDEALAQVAIPEPAALTLMGLALPLVLRRRKA